MAAAAAADAADAAADAADAGVIAFASMQHHHHASTAGMTTSSRLHQTHAGTHRASRMNVHTCVNSCKMSLWRANVCDRASPMPPMTVPISSFASDSRCNNDSISLAFVSASCRRDTPKARCQAPPS